VESNPWPFTSVLFTSLVFVAYDAVIEKRQRKVMQSATRSSAIVSSLFPSKVRTRLYEESASSAPLEKEQSPHNRMKHFLIKAQTSSVEPINTGPIADLFESTTVLFADIKGFTKWYVLFFWNCPVLKMLVGNMSQEFVARTHGGFHLVGNSVWCLRPTSRNVGSVQGESRTQVATHLSVGRYIIKD
jgi:hypothetical protein